MKTFIVFGANGFIGSNLVDHLSKQYKVVAVDTYTSKPIFEQNSNLEVITGDILDSSKLLTTLRKIKINGIVWAIGSLIPADQTKDERVVLSKVTKQKEILKSFISLQKPVVLTSSAGMLYSGNEIFTEDSKISPWTVYGREKQMLEESVLSNAKNYNNHEVKIIRISSVYGERQPTNRAQGVIGKIIENTLKGEDFHLYGSILAERDYIYVKDLAAIIEKLLIGNFKFNIYNVSTGKSNSLKDVIRIVEKETKLKLNILFEEQRNIDPVHIRISNERLKKEVGAFNFTSLDAGLIQTIKWFRKNL